MDFGLLFPFRNPPQWRQPFAAFYAEQLHQAQLAEQLGYDTIWLTEHHFAEDGYSPSLLPIAGALADMTSRVRIGTPEEVTRELQQFVKDIRTTHLVLGMHLPGLDPAKSRGSMELFAKEVMPRLR
jgi:alkanesulfonate monooxygenase SsuD/methylene tetrahydromethanopterin reductase-like flavin-dependent oxidoreductase (luciferase family)